MSMQNAGTARAGTARRHAPCDPSSRWITAALVGGFSLCAATLPGAVASQPASTIEATAPSTSARDDAAFAELVDRYREHVTILASSFFEGRIPGSDGLERAAKYIEFNLRTLGLTPAFGGGDGSLGGVALTAVGADGDAAPAAPPSPDEAALMVSPWRQPFTVGSAFSSLAYTTVGAAGAETEAAANGAPTPETNAGGAGAAPDAAEAAATTAAAPAGVLTWNVGGVLEGQGDLADEWIVFGAHYDHLGLGYFGSRGTPGEVHPGADDNASGVAGVLLAAQELSAWRATLDPDVPARSILFLFFSGEESGLNGSRHYVEHPIAPIDQHVLMINFDMIGRVMNDRLAISGVESGAGMEAWLKPFFESSPLVETFPESVSARSDHAPFYRSRVPVLFAIIADFHTDYHTPGDVAAHINAEGGARTVELFVDIARALAQRSERFAYSGDPAKVGDGEGGPSFRNMKVRFGIVPAHYDESRPGVAVQGVSPGTSAEKGGVLPGDELMRWNGVPITGIRHWMSLLAEHEPGDIAEVEVFRNGETLILNIELLGREP